MTTPHSAPDDRRGFLTKLLALGLGRCLGRADVLGTGGIPQSLAAEERGRQRIRVATLAALRRRPPQRCPVIADRADAWNRYPDEAVGAVFLY